MSNEDYFLDINSAVDEIVATVGRENKLQPKDGPRRDARDQTKWTKDSGAVYMTSVRNREVKAHREGVVTLMPYGTLIGLSAGSTVVALGNQSEVGVGPEQVAEFLARVGAAGVQGESGQQDGHT